jgi:hypothetical protein
MAYPAQEEQSAANLAAEVHADAHVGKALGVMINWRAIRALSLFPTGPTTVEVTVTVEVL